MPNTRPLIDSLESRTLFATLTAGVTYATSINASKPLKNWSISLKAGQAIYVTAGVPAGAAVSPELVLISPNHKTLARSVGERGAMTGKVAPVTGTYVVRVFDARGSGNSSSVSVTAVFTGSTPIADGDDGGTASSGRRFAASIDPGDFDVWRIDATSGQFLSVVANENSVNSPVGVGVVLLGPDGSGVASKESETGFALDVPGVKTGTYYAVVYETAVNASGRYGISFGLTPGAQTTEDPDTQQPLVSGTPRTGDLPSGDIDLFQVSLAKGKKVSITVTRTGSTLTPAILLIDPSGKEVTSTSGTSSATLTYTTLTAGTFSILLRNRDASMGGSYKLTYTVA